MLQQLMGRSAELKEAAEHLLKQLPNADQLQVLAVVGLTTAKLLQELAPSLAAISGEQTSVDRLTQLRKEAIERNRAVNLAAASGNWTEFDKLAGIQTGDTTANPTGAISGG